MRLVLAGLAAMSLVFSGAVQAQDFSGTYTVTNDAGATVTLVLNQDAQGQVTGSLTAPGVRYEVNGMVDEGSVLGTVSSEMGGLYFAAEFDAGQLYMTLFEPDAYNQPNYESGQTIVFARAGGAQPTPAPQPAPPPPAAAAPTGGGSIETGLPIAFGLPRATDVKITIWDVAGRRVRELASGFLPAGRHAQEWDGRGDGGRVRGAGVYFVRLDLGDRSVTRKLVRVE